MASASRPAADGCEALTEKEKQTLRLIVRGHDAKSIARELDLSVHTINERLRDARRKLAVSSSREAARLLLETEAATPENRGDKQIGEAAAAPAVSHKPALARSAFRSVGAVAGVTVMSALLAILVLSAQPQTVQEVGTPPVPGAVPSATPASQAVVEQAARNWLAVVDDGRWEASYRETGAAFRKLNTVEAWTKASEQARAPLGAVRSRALLTHDTMPAPPHGYDVLRFRTEFAAKPVAVETVTLEREGSGWKVVAYIID